jgi:hypothetical protein
MREHHHQAADAFGCLAAAQGDDLGGTPLDLGQGMPITNRRPATAATFRPWLEITQVRKGGGREAV